MNKFISSAIILLISINILCCKEKTYTEKDVGAFLVGHWVEETKSNNIHPGTANVQFGYKNNKLKLVLDSSEWVHSYDNIRIKALNNDKFSLIFNNNVVTTIKILNDDKLQIIESPKIEIPNIDDNGKTFGLVDFTDNNTIYIKSNNKNFINNLDN